MHHYPISLHELIYRLFHHKAEVIQHQIKSEHEYKWLADKDSEKEAWPI